MLLARTLRRGLCGARVRLVAASDLAEPRTARELVVPVPTDDGRSVRHLEVFVVRDGDDEIRAYEQEQGLGPAASAEVLGARLKELLQQKERAWMLDGPDAVSPIVLLEHGFDVGDGDGDGNDDAPPNNSPTGT